MTLEQKYEQISKGLKKDEIVLVHKPGRDSKLEQKTDLAGNPALQIVRKHQAQPFLEDGWVEYAPAPVATKKSTRTAKDS